MRAKGTAKLRRTLRPWYSNCFTLADPAACAEPPDPEAENDERDPENDREGADQPGKKARMSPKRTERAPPIIINHSLSISRLSEMAARISITPVTMAHNAIT